MILVSSVARISIVLLAAPLQQSVQPAIQILICIAASVPQFARTAVHMAISQMQLIGFALNVLRAANLFITTYALQLALLVGDQTLPAYVLTARIAGSIHIITCANPVAQLDLAQIPPVTALPALRYQSTFTMVSVCRLVQVVWEVPPILTYVSVAQTVEKSLLMASANLAVQLGMVQIPTALAPFNAL